ALLPIVFGAVRDRRHAVWLVVALVAGGAISATYGLLYGPPAETVRASRLSGAGVDPNGVAQALLVGTVLAIALAASRRISSPARLCATVLAIVSGLALCLTVSREALVGMAAALALLPFLAGPGRRA